MPSSLLFRGDQILLLKRLTMTAQLRSSNLIHRIGHIQNLLVMVFVP